MNIVDMKSKKEIAPSEQQTENVSVGLTTIKGFELAQRAAKLLASSSLVPERYRGNLADCVVALNMAQRMGSDPLMTMQHLYVVHGTPAWSAQMLISVWNQCGRYTSIRYQFEGEQGKDHWGCRAASIERETKEVIEGALITIGMAKSEGWYGKKGSKWQTMPEQMLRYRAAAWLVRAYAPELAMGFQTVEEVHDVYDAVPGRDGAFSVSDLRKEPDDSGLSAAFDAVDPEDQGQGQGQEPESWPREDNGRWIDSRGVAFDGRVHGMSAGHVPSVTKLGVFAKRRGCDESLHAQVEREALDALGNAHSEKAPEDDAAEAPDTENTGFSPSDIALAIRRCTLIDDCDDVEDMLRDSDADQEIRLNLTQALEERRARISNIDIGGAA